MLNQLIITVMTAKEFFEQNRGKYFYYEGEKIRVVGYGGTTHRILVSKKEGWYWGSFQSRSVDYIDQTLIYTGDTFWFVKEEDLTPIDKPELDLCKLLEGCEGMVFYSAMVGYCRLIEVIEYEEYIVISYDIDETIALDQDGKYSIDGECTLFPSKENRDWSTFVNPNKIKEGTPVMTKWDNASFWKLENYTKDNKSDFIVPVSDFNFTDFDSNKSKSIK